MENPAPEGNLREAGSTAACGPKSAPSRAPFPGLRRETSKSFDRMAVDYFDCVEPHLQPLPDKWNDCLNIPSRSCVCCGVCARRQGDGRVMNYVIEKMASGASSRVSTLPSRCRRASSVERRGRGWFFFEILSAFRRHGSDALPSRGSEISQTRSPTAIFMNGHEE